MSTSDYERVGVPIASRKVDSRPRFFWEATVRFETDYNLPNNVLETAVVRAIAAADKTVQVLNLVALIPPALP